MNITDNNLCTFCKTDPETLFHLIWECPNNVDFVIRKLQVMNFESTILNINFFIFGVHDNMLNNNNYTMLFLEMKRYIVYVKIKKGHAKY